MSQYITRISYIYMFILVRIFLLILRCLFCYLSSFILTFLTLYVCIFIHIVHIVMLYFRAHLNIILHTYLSIYYVFVCVSHTGMHMLYSPFTSHFIHTHLICFCTHVSFILSKPFCNTCIAYVYVSHTFGFDFLFSKAEASHSFVLYLLKILEYK